MIAKISTFVVYTILVFNYCNVLSVRKLQQTIHHVENCDIPKERYDPNNTIEYTMKSMADSKMRYMKGNYTIKEKTLPINYTIRAYKIIGTERRFEFHIEGLTCRNPMIVMVLNKMKFKCRNDCTCNAGNFITEKINLDDMRKTYRYAYLSPGKYIFDLEFLTKNGVILCMATFVTTGS